MSAKSIRIEEASCYYDTARQESRKDGRSGGVSMAQVANQFSVSLARLKNFRANNLHRKAKP